MLGCSGQDRYTGRAGELNIVLTAAGFAGNQRIVQFGAKRQVGRSKVGKRTFEVVVPVDNQIAGIQSGNVVELDARVVFGPGVAIGQNILVTMVNCTKMVFMRRESEVQRR